MSITAIKTKAAEKLARRDWTGLAEACLELIAAEPNEPAHIQNLAAAYERQENLEHQVATLKLGMKRFPGTWKDFADRLLHAFFRNGLVNRAYQFMDEQLKEQSDEKRYDLVLQVPSDIEPDLLKTNTSVLIARNPTDEKLRVTVARQLISMKLYEHAESILTKIIDPSDEALLYKGLAAGRQGRIQESLSLLSDAEESAKTNHSRANILRWRAEILFRAMRQDEAIQALEASVKLDPTNNSSFQAMYTQLHYSDAVDLEKIAENSRAWNKNLKLISTKYTGQQISTAQLKIGFISQGFKIHPVGWMSAGVFCELSQRTDVEWHIFDLSPGTDYIAKTIQTVCNNYHRVSDLSDRSLYDLIKSKQLDFLIDCDGFQAGNRLPVVLRKPARHNVKWIGGLVGSTFLDSFDYLVTDEAQTPSNEDEKFSETLIRMPDNYVTYTPPPYQISVNEPPCESNGHITFGCFNNGIKITTKTIQLWSAILQRVQDSRIILKDRLFDWDENKERILAAFSAEGVDNSRIEFKGGSAHETHLFSHNDVDICLDPIPYSGGLCTLESTFMGVPVVALGGELLCHRHSVTHLNVIGHKELVANTEAEYVELAVELACDESRIAKYRSNLRNDLVGSPLLNHLKFTDHFVETLKKAAYH